MKAPDRAVDTYAVTDGRRHRTAGAMQRMPGGHTGPISKGTRGGITSPSPRQFHPDTIEEWARAALGIAKPTRPDGTQRSTKRRKKKKTTEVAPEDRFDRSKVKV